MQGGFTPLATPRPLRGAFLGRRLRRKEKNIFFVVFTIPCLPRQRPLHLGCACFALKLAAEGPHCLASILANLAYPWIAAPLLEKPAIERAHVPSDFE